MKHMSLLTEGQVGLNLIHALLKPESIFVSNSMSASIHLPPHLRAWLDGWGQELRTDLEQAFHAVASPIAWPDFIFDAKPLQGSRPCCSSHPSRPSRPSHPSAACGLRVGTDCSGVESPIHALKSLGVCHRHLFSSECATAPRKVIEANTLPTHRFLEDVHCPSNVLPHVDLYVSGFSCKPFSMLHWGTALLDEEEAKVFYSVLQRIQALRPAVFVLENVRGISRCMTAVLSLLEGAGYKVVVENFNPIDLGEPLNRPRFYFLGIRADLARATQAEAQSFCKQVWSKLSQQRLQRNKALHGTPVVPLWERLLSDDSDLVIAHRERCLQRWNEAKQAGFPESRGKCKWKQTHREWEEGRELKLAEGNLQLAELTPDKLHLHLPRERDAWWKLIHTFGEPVQVIADISQSLGRMPCRTDGVLPTITPGSHIVVGAFGRTLISHEKLLLHGLPLHRMVLPKEISDSELESMGGNMMHLQTVAVAMVVALSLVDWSQPHAHSFVPAPVFPAVPAIPAVPASAATKPRGRKAKRKKPSAAGTKLECQLKARFGIGARTAPSAKVRRATKRVAKTKRCPKAVECLCGTRWASKRL